MDSGILLSGKAIQLFRQRAGWELRQTPSLIWCEVPRGVDETQSEVARSVSNHISYAKDVIESADAVGLLYAAFASTS